MSADGTSADGTGADGTGAGGTGADGTGAAGVADAAGRVSTTGTSGAGAPGARPRLSLTARIVLAVLAVGVIAVVVTAAISVLVVDRIVDDQARRALHTRALQLARLPDARARTLVTAGPFGGRFALVEPDGAAVGPVAASVTPALLAAVERRGSVSRTVDVDGHRVVLEAVRRPSGGAVVAVRRLADVRGGNAVFLDGLLGALAAGVAAAVIAGVLVGRRLGSPLARLARDARRLADGERGIRVAAQPVPEIEGIADALRSLDHALATSEGRQREFLLSVSHELRTPLTAVRGYAEALADGVVPADEIVDVGATLVAEAVRLSRFTDDLLALARLEADDFRIEVVEADVALIARQVVEAWRAAAARAGIRLVADVPRMPVRTDPQRLRQVLDGLVENALRVTPAGGIVRIAAAPAALGCWGLAVADTGPGLTADDVRVAFERGELHARYRGERAVGTGLGLSIARRLVTRLGGRIAVEASEEPGASGAVFRLELPALPDPNTRLTDA